MYEERQPMDMNEYQDKARSFASGGGTRLEYALLGLAEEAGEACGKAAKYIRKTDWSGALVELSHNEIERKALLAELGDCLWMVANAAAALGCPLGRLAAMNIEKLEGRKARGTIIGEGDNR